MNTTTSIRFALAAVALVAASATAYAASDDPQMRDGSTGVMTMPPDMSRAPTRGPEVQRLSHGEASTFVNGRPNAEPDAPMATGAMRRPTQSMGGAAARPMAHGPSRAQMGGTPD